MTNKDILKVKHEFVYLDFLRGIAAICVVLLHWFDGNQIGLFYNSKLAVDLFFMLSGFVIALSYQDKLKAGYSKRIFAVKRIVRLYPLIVLGICIGVARLLLSYYFETGAWDVSVVFQALKTLFLIPDSFVADDLVDIYPINGPMWSLLFEIIAYLVFASVLYRLKTPPLIIVAAAFLPIVFLWITLQTTGDTPHLWTAFVSREYVSAGYIYGLARVLTGFTIGVLIFRLWRKYSASKRLSKPAIVVFTNLFFLAVILFVFSAEKERFGTLSTFLFYFLVLPGAIFSGTYIEVRGTTRTVMKTLGEISYPIYIIHVPLMWSFNWVLRKLDFTLVNGSEAWNIVIVGPVLIAVSLLASRIYDMPLRRTLLALFDRVSVRG